MGTETILPKNAWDIKAQHIAFWNYQDPKIMQKLKYNSWFYSSDALIYGEGSQHWAFISQVFLGKK